MNTILFVDDDDSILRSIRRLFALHDFDILTATSGQKALEIIKKKTISVLVSDQRMPNMLGTELVATVKEVSPQTIRMILTGYADLESIIGAINKGEIYRFILKPWNDEQLIAHVTDALIIYEENQVQKEQVILALAQAIELKDPYTKGHCERVAKYSVGLAEQYGLDEPLISDIRRGAWLHDCGKIAATPGEPGLIGYFHVDTGIECACARKERESHVLSAVFGSVGEGFQSGIMIFLLPQAHPSLSRAVR